MSNTGRLVQWDEHKGYGFIRPEGGGDKVFVHASAWRTRARPPQVGDRLSYRIAQQADGRLRAQQVQWVEAGATSGVARPASPGARSGSGASVLWLIPAFALVVVLVHLQRPLPHGLWGVYMAMSLASFITYALDKRAARLQRWRVPEWQLLLLALACGWPGSLLAQQILRHKSAKSSFRWCFALAACLNVIGFVGLFAWAI